MCAETLPDDIKIYKYRKTKLAAYFDTTNDKIPLGLPNTDGSSCFMNCIMACLANTPNLVNLELCRGTMYARVFYAIISYLRGALKLNHDTLKWFRATGPPVLQSNQQSAEEFLMKMADQIDEAGRSENPQNASVFVNNINTIKTTNTTTCSVHSTLKTDSKNEDTGIILCPLPPTESVGGVKPTSITITELLRSQYFNHIELDTDNHINCPTCDNKTKVNTSIRDTTMVTPAKNVIISLKIYKDDGDRRKDILVTDILHTQLWSGCDKWYKLAGVVRHLGASTSGGHYIAIVWKNDKWYSIDDAAVREIQTNVIGTIENIDNMILFYNEDESQPATPPQPRPCLDV
jgi:ubiquitin C-terminal hydrolase